MKNELFKWLKANLGKRCLAPLTGSDASALVAAYAIAEAMCNADNVQMEHLLAAFGHVVRTMQRSVWHLAYHAIAKARDWSDRLNVWQQAGLELPQIRDTICSFEPGGSGKDLSRV